MFWTNGKRVKKQRIKDVLDHILVLSFFFVFPLPTVASDLSLEKDLQKALEQSRTVLDRIKKK
jgi:hypothetical protein